MISLNTSEVNSVSVSKTLYKKRFWYILFVSLVFALFSQTLSYTYVGLYLIYCVAFLLLMFLVIRKVSLVYYIVLLAIFNMGEYSKYVSQEGFYTFETVGVFGVTFATIFIAILVVYKFLFSKKRFKALKSPILRLGLFIFFIALCIGIAHLFFGDTPLAGFQDNLGYFIILFGSFYLAYDFADIEIVREILLITILISPLVVLYGWVLLPLGSYGGVSISSFDPLYYAIPLIPSFLLLSRKQAQSKVPFWLVAPSSICSIATIILQPSGKALFFLPTSVILVWLVSIKKYSIKKFVLIGIALVLIILVSIHVYSDVVGSYGNILFKSKSYEVTSLFEVAPKMLNNPEAVYLIAPSPRIRVLEFMNILYELRENPAGLIVGKGIGGSFTDKYYPIPFTLGAYSEDQWSSHEFYRVHETLNFVLLKFGILGIVFLLFFVIWLLRKLHYELSGETAFLYVVLTFGVLFMLGYSLKLAVFMGIMMGTLMGKQINSCPVEEKK